MSAGILHGAFVSAHLGASACTKLIQVPADIPLPTSRTRLQRAVLSPTETPGWLMRASQKSTWNGKTARNLSQIAAKIRRGHAALPAYETNGSTGRRLGMVISQALLPAIRKEPAVKCYLVSHSFKYNRKLLHSH